MVLWCLNVSALFCCYYVLERWDSKLGMPSLTAVLWVRIQTLLECVKRRHICKEVTHKTLLFAKNCDDGGRSNILDILVILFLFRHATTTIYTVVYYRSRVYWGIGSHEYYPFFAGVNKYQQLGILQKYTTEKYPKGLKP